MNRSVRWGWVALVVLTALARAESPPPKGMIELLEKEPQAQKDTPDFHARLAKWHHLAGNAEPAADEALIARLAGAPAAGPLAEVTPGLAREAKAKYDEAVAKLAAKDMKAAVQAYLQALKRDSAVLGRDDRGLRATAFEALKKSAARTPDFAHRWKLALYAYLFGELETASTELKTLAGGAPVEMTWRVGMLSAKVESELAQVKADDAKARAASTPPAPRDAGGSLPDLSPSPDGGPAPDPNSSRRIELQAEIEKTDRLIQYYSNPDGYKYNIDDSGDSRVIKYSSSGPRLQEKIENLKAKKAALELELSNLR